MLLLLIASSCSNLRYLEDGQYLYTGSKIQFESDEKIGELPKLETELNRVIRPVPNQHILFWRPRLWLYNVAGEPTGRGVRHLMKNRFGRPPVLFNLADVERSQRLMENRLFNMGYFDASVAYTIHQKEQTARVNYIVGLRSPYLFGNLYDMQPVQAMPDTLPVPSGTGPDTLPDVLPGVRPDTLPGVLPGVIPDTLPDPSHGSQGFLLPNHAGVSSARVNDSLSIHINALLAETTIIEGSPYRLSQLRAERVRIDRGLKQRGYFFFHPDHILFLADTTNGLRRADIHPTIKPDMPMRARQPYRIGNMTVEADYMVHSHVEGERDDGVQIRDGVTLFDAERQFKPVLIDRAIFLEPGDIYNLDDHNQSIRHLTGLGVFRFVNMRFLPRMEEDHHYLDVHVMLSPASKKRLSAELRGVSKSNNFAGPGLRASFSNINLLGGAEHFDLSLTASYEALISGRLDPASAWEFGVEAGLTVPRFLMPFLFRSGSQQFVPKTKLSLGVNFLNRTDAFGLTSVKAQYGYEWNQSLIIRHRFSPMVFNLFVLGQVSDQLDRVLATGALLRRGLFEQFILGSEYSWFYNSQLRDQEERLNDYYANINIDLAGNLLYGFSVLAGREPDSDGVHDLFGQGFAQYVRTDVDLRYYRRLGGQQRIATRLVAGVGLPYANSETLPYLKLFSVGGSNGIRAFHPRTLGPGTYAPPDTLAGRFNIYQSGEVKLEMSAEYRFGITSLLKGALFADAGNVWRLQDHEEIPGGRFQWDSFYKQIALGTGAGIRLDATFFILRLDLAFPLAVPSRERESFFEPVRPLSRSWRRENLVFNLAIGYPF